MEQINVNLENLTDEEREQLLALIKKGNKKPKKRWRAEKNDYYFYVDDCERVRTSCEDMVDGDNARYNISNYFQNKEEAQFELEKRKVYQELKNYALEHNECEIDWNDEYQYKYTFNFDHSNGVFYIYKICRSHEIGQIYFTSKEIAKEAIQSVGEHRIKKYLFGMEE